MTRKGLHGSNTFNVEASLNAWVTRRLNEIERPDWLADLHIITHYEDIPARLPCISITHLPVYRGGKWERGGEAAHLARAMLDANCWVSRSQTYAGQNVWQARLRWMQSMVEQVFGAEQTVVIQDFDTSLVARQDTAFRVFFADMNVVQTGTDPNPDIERRRILINYRWFARSE